MAAEADTPVVDPTHRVGDDVTVAVGCGLGKVARVIGGGVGATLAEGQNGHLIASPTVRAFRGYMALLTRQMLRYVCHDLFELGGVRRAIDAWIGMTVLTFADQGVGIVSVVHGGPGGHGRRCMAGRASATAHNGNATITARWQQGANPGGKGMAGAARIVDLAIS